MSYSQDGHKLSAKIMPGLLLLSVYLLSFILTSCGKKPQDNQLVDFQKDLLDIAFKTASAIPPEPHIKDRSRAQENVVMACLELDLPVRASQYAARIENWRQGLCYAQLALFLAENDLKKDANQYLEKAAAIAAEDHGQQWRSNRIKAKIAETKLQLGDFNRSADIKKELANSETDTTAQAYSKLTSDDSFDKQVEAMESLIQSGDFAMIKIALKNYIKLFKSNYSDSEKRTIIEKNIRTALDKIPVFIRIELLIELADAAKTHSDNDSALRYLSEAQEYLDNATWPLDQQIKLTAKLSRQRSICDDNDTAEKQADSALDLFNKQKEQIVNIYRAEALESLAMAYASMGNIESALAVYTLAFEESIVNPNSRPRAEDISALCCSMALNAVEPDSELWLRIRQISDRLGPPW